MGDTRLVDMGDEVQHGTWYHGSPQQLSTLLAGSTITPRRHLAEVFSHKPQLVAVADDGSISHNGTLAGWLHVVDEPIGITDIYPHPRTTMEVGWEWLTRRDLHLRLIGTAHIEDSERLPPSEVTVLGQRMQWRGMLQQIVIRPFRTSDQTPARALILQGLGEHFGFIDESMNPDLDDLSVNYCTCERILVVAEQDTQLVGTGALVTLDEHTAQMVRVSVSSAYRRRGIARRIVTMLVDIARQWGYERMEVETNNDWFDAIGLYQSLGFVEHDRDDISVYMALSLQ